MKHVAISTARLWSKKLGINMSAAITCVKPEGTGSKMLGTGSGIHAWEDHYQIRRVRISATDPLFAMLRDQGVPYHPEVGEDPAHPSTYVLEFLLAAPKGAKTVRDVGAIQQL
jgi:hypothetical protein